MTHLWSRWLYHLRVRVRLLLHRDFHGLLLLPKVLRMRKIQADIHGF